MTDLEIAEVRLDVARHVHADAKRAARAAEVAWIEAVETRAISSSLASLRYFKAERTLEDASDQLEQARAALQSAEIENEVA